MSTCGKGLDDKIVRPGPLSNEERAGTVHIAEKVDDLSTVFARADVADVVAHIIDETNTYHKTFELLGGSTPL